MPPSPETWTLEELAQKVGENPRTIRSWIAQGLLLGPDQRGRYARYSSAHLQRVLEIQRLKQAMPLDRVRQVLSGVSSPESALSYIRSLSGASEVPATPSPEPTPHRSTNALPGPAAPEETLDRLVRELRRLVLHRPVARTSRAEAWVRIPITPDLELGLRGTPSEEQLRRFERVADHLRDILLGGLEND
jgi:DNA-binding transcriptional MerR regulator